MTERVWPPRVSPPSRPFTTPPLRPGERPAHARSDEELDEVMGENEQRRLERKLARLTTELDRLEANEDLATPRNRRYNVNFSFPWVDSPAADPEEPIAFATSAVVINTGRRFYAMQLEMHYSLQSTGATFALGPNLMREFFDFEWRIRDTGTDREWSNDWLPSDFLYSGDVCGLLTPSAPALLSGNTSVEVDVRVLYSDNSGTGALFASIERHLLQLSFVGVEVPE